MVIKGILGNFAHRREGGMCGTPGFFSFQRLLRRKMKTNTGFPSRKKVGFEGFFAGRMANNDAIAHARLPRIIKTIIHQPSAVIMKAIGLFFTAIATADTSCEDNDGTTRRRRRQRHTRMRYGRNISKQKKFSFLILRKRRKKGVKRG